MMQFVPIESANRTFLKLFAKLSVYILPNFRFILIKHPEADYKGVSIIDIAEFLGWYFAKTKIFKICETNKQNSRDC